MYLIVSVVKLLTLLREYKTQNNSRIFKKLNTQVMEAFGALDQYTVGRIENVLGKIKTTNFKDSIRQVIGDLLLDGYAPEDIHDYIRGVVIEELDGGEE